MAHFAEISKDNLVLRVLVVPKDYEARGEAFLREDLGLGGHWVQTSYSGAIRLRFAGVGMVWDAVRDAFVLPQRIRPVPQRLTAISASSSRVRVHRCG